MTDVIGIELLQMMENAGRSPARLALTMFDPGHGPQTTPEYDE